MVDYKGFEIPESKEEAIDVLNDNFVVGNIIIMNKEG